MQKKTKSHLCKRKQNPFFIDHIDTYKYRTMEGFWKGKGSRRRRDQEVGGFTSSGSTVPLFQRDKSHSQTCKCIRKKEKKISKNDKQQKSN